MNDAQDPWEPIGGLLGDSLWGPLYVSFRPALCDSLFDSLRVSLGGALRVSLGGALRASLAESIGDE